MKKKHTNNKQPKFTVISVVTTVAPTKFRSSSLTFYAYKLLKIVSTQAVGLSLSSHVGSDTVPVDGVGRILYSHCLYQVFICLYRSILTKTFGSRQFVFRRAGQGT